MRSLDLFSAVGFSGDILSGRQLGALLLQGTASAIVIGTDTR